jgi:hypothetical protein
LLGHQGATPEQITIELFESVQDFEVAFRPLTLSSRANIMPLQCILSCYNLQGAANVRPQEAQVYGSTKLLGNNWEKL